LEGSLESLQIEGFDVHEIYQQKKLRLGKLFVRQPKLQFSTKPMPQEQTQIAKLNLFLKSIELEELHLENGQIQIHQENKQGKIHKMQSKQVSGSMKSLALHLDQQHKPKSIKKFDNSPAMRWGLGNANFTLQNIHFDFPDNTHTLTINTLDFDYAHSLAKLKEVTLLPTGAKKLKQNRIQAQIPEIEIDAKDLRAMVEGKNWEIEALKMKKPLFDIYLAQPKKQQNEPALQLAHLFEKMPFNKLAINHLEIDSGSVQLAYKPVNQRTHQLALQNFKLQLGHFEIDSAKHHWQQIFDLAHLSLVVEKYHHRLPDGVHQISANHLGLFSEDSLLIISDLHISPVQKLGIPFSIEEQAKQNKIDIFSPHIYLKGWDLTNFLEERKLHFSKAIISTPLLKLQLHRQDTTRKLKDFTQKLRADSLHKIISPFVNYLKINDLQLIHGNLNLLTFRDKKINTFQLDSISMRVKNFDVHPTKPEKLLIDEWHTVLPPAFVFDRTPYQFLNSEDIKIEVKNYTFQLPDNMHILKAKSISLSTKDSTITANEVGFTPSLGKVEFSKIQKFKKAWLYPYVQSLKIQQFDFYNLLHHTELKMRSITLDSLKFEIYRDRGLPADPDYLPPMPQDLLRELPILVKVDSIKLRNGNIIYEEQLPTQARAGRLVFEGSEAQILNLTNHPDSLKKSDFQAFINFKTYLMGMGKFVMEGNFYLADPRNIHTLRGELGAMPITAFNEMLEYVLPVRVESGFIQSGKFDIRFDYKQAKGKMYLRYNNLKVEVINRKFASFVANSFVVTNHNPSRRFAPLREGEIKSRRTLNRSIFSYWGYSVLNGFKTSIGLRAKKQQKKAKLDTNKKLKIKKLKVRKKKQIV
jgi:hypothetical protein